MNLRTIVPPLSWDTLDDFAAIAFAVPLVSLVIAAVALAVVLSIRAARRPASAPATVPPAVLARYRPERILLGVGAGVVIVAYAVEYLLRGFVISGLENEVEWWRFLTPIAAAGLVLAVALGVIVTRGTGRPAHPFAPSTPRTWTSFAPRAGLVGAGVAIGLFVLTSVLCGLASSPDEQGRWIHLEIAVPNSDIAPLRPWFYGWAYSVPALLGLVAFALLLLAMMRMLRPERPGRSADETVAATAEAAAR